MSAFSEAAASPAEWGTAMDSAAQEAEAYGALLLPVRVRLQHFPVSQTLMRAAESYVSEGWVHRDERAKAMPAMLKNGVATDFDAISPDEMRRNQYYQDMVVPHNLHWFAGVRVVADGDTWCLSILRSHSQGRFQPHELEKLNQLGALLGPAAMLARALGLARAEGAMAAFEMSETAALMLNSAGEVIKLNAQAERLLGQDVMIMNRRLRSKLRAVSDALDSSVFRVLSRADSPSAAAIAMPREFGRPLIASVLRADSLAMGILSPAKAFILLADTDQHIVPDLIDLRNVFGLTGAEGRLVIELQRGCSLSEAASRLRITYETARSTLKQAFRKTESSSQAELLRLVSKLRSAPDILKAIAQVLLPLVGVAP